MLVSRIGCLADPAMVAVNSSARVACRARIGVPQPVTAAGAWPITPSVTDMPKANTLESLLYRQAHAKFWLDTSTGAVYYRNSNAPAQSDIRFLVKVSSEYKLPYGELVFLLKTGRLRRPALVQG
jgi:hypothetical protein